MTPEVNITFNNSFATANLFKNQESTMNVKAKDFCYSFHTIDSLEYGGKIYIANDTITAYQFPVAQDATIDLKTQNL